MMTINRNNYEIYFLDYRENQLPMEDVADLMLFLEQNPDLKKEFESFDDIQLVPEKDITFNSKHELKKQTITEVDGINDGNYEEYFIGSVEKELDTDEEASLLLFMEKNPFLLKELSHFKNSKLSPETNIVFPDKSSLYKKAVVFYQNPVLYYAASAAAIVLLFFSLYLNFDSSKNSARYTARLDHGDVVPENDVVDTATEREEQIESPSEEYNTSGVQTIINQNPVSKKRSSITGKKNRKTDVNNIKLKKIDNIKITSIDITIPPSKLIINDDRDYIYYLFMDSYVHADQAREAGPNERNSVLVNAFSRIKGVLKNDNPKKDNDEKTTFWDIADAGINGFNRLTGNDLILARKYDQEGNVKAMAFRSESFEVSRTKNTQGESAAAPQQ